MYIAGLGRGRGRGRGRGMGPGPQSVIPQRSVGAQQNNEHMDLQSMSKENKISKLREMIESLQQKLAILESAS
jgi:hypothetical protein